MHTLKLNIQDSVFDKVYYFLSNLPKNEVEIIEDKTVEDWSFLESEIDKGLDSGVSNKSHEDIIKSIKQKYA
jgi:hypothetical protein